MEMTAFLTSAISSERASTDACDAGADGAPGGGTDEAGADSSDSSSSSDGHDRPSIIWKRRRDFPGEASQCFQYVSFLHLKKCYNVIFFNL